MSKKKKKILLILSIFFSIYCALIIGQSWDQGHALLYGKTTLEYLFSLGSIDNHFYYREYNSTLYYTALYLLTNIFPSKYSIEVSNLINLTFSLGCIFGIKKISKTLFNNKVGNIVFVILFFFPIFFGHMAFNHKDTILAFSHVWIVYLIFNYLKKQQFRDKANEYIIFIGILSSLATGIKFPFLITLVPIFLFVLLDIFIFKKITSKNFKIKIFFLDIIKCFIIFYLLLIAFWIDVFPNIITLPFTIVKETLSPDFWFGWPYALVDGEYYLSKQVPSNYFLISLFYKSPEYFLLTYLFFLFLLIKSNKFFIKKFNFFYYKLLLVISVIIFPTFLLFIMPYPVYDGIRLFLWSIPYFCIIPGLTIYYLIENFNYIKSKISLTFIIFLIIFYLVNFFTITPYQYTYLNSFIGKKENSYKKFENDYWGSSMRELVKISNFERNKVINIATCGVNHNIVKKYLKKKKNLTFAIVKPDKADYIIMTNRVILRNNNSSSVDELTNCFDKFSGENVFEVKRNGFILSTIRKRFY